MKGSNPIGLQVSLAEMLVGGVIVEVTTASEAALAEAAGASGVLVVPLLAAAGRLQAGVGRLADLAAIASVQAAVSIPVMAKCRIGHEVEAEILAELGVDYIEESDTLTPVEWPSPIRKAEWRTPFIVGATDLASALRGIAEGAAVVRCSGGNGTGNVARTVQQLRAISAGARQLQQYAPAELPTIALELGVPKPLLLEVAKRGRLPVVVFGAGGVASPADAALLRRAGADCVVVGSGIFHGANPERRAAAIVTATAHFSDAQLITQVSQGLGREFPGVALPQTESLGEDLSDEWGY